jgi:hypothetical protein
MGAYPLTECWMMMVLKIRVMEHHATTSNIVTEVGDGTIRLQHSVRQNLCLTECWMMMVLKIRVMEHHATTSNIVSEVGDGTIRLQHSVRQNLCMKFLWAKYVSVILYSFHRAFSLTILLTNKRTNINYFIVLLISMYSPTCVSVRRPFSGG